MKYAVVVTEVLERRVVVEAEDVIDAMDKVQAAYDALEIVLDSSDYHGDMKITCNGQADEVDIRWCQKIGEEEFLLKQLLIF